MFSLQSKLDSAMGVFSKAKKKLDSVIEDCDKHDARADVAEDAATDLYDTTMNYINSNRAKSAAVRKSAQASVNQINKIIGE